MRGGGRIALSGMNVYSCSYHQLVNRYICYSPVIDITEIGTKYLPYDDGSIGDVYYDMIDNEVFLYTYDQNEDYGTWLIYMYTGSIGYSDDYEGYEIVGYIPAGKNIDDHKVIMGPGPGEDSDSDESDIIDINDLIHVKHIHPEHDHICLTFYKDGQIYVDGYTSCGKYPHGWIDENDHYVKSCVDNRNIVHPELGIVGVSLKCEIDKNYIERSNYYDKLPILREFSTEPDFNLEKRSSTE